MVETQFELDDELQVWLDPSGLAVFEELELFLQCGLKGRATTTPKLSKGESSVVRDHIAICSSLCHLRGQGNSSSDSGNELHMVLIIFRCELGMDSKVDRDRL